MTHVASSDKYCNHAAVGEGEPLDFEEVGTAIVRGLSKALMVMPTLLAMGGMVGNFYGQ